MGNTSTSDIYSTTLTHNIIFDGECVRYSSTDLPGVFVDHWSHEDHNHNMVEIDLSIAGVVGEDAYHETFLVNIHEAADFTHGLFNRLLS
jgi:hypothetical protein